MFYWTFVAGVKVLIAQCCCIGLFKSAHLARDLSLNEENIMARMSPPYDEMQILNIRPDSEQIVYRALKDLPPEYWVVYSKVRTFNGVDGETDFIIFHPPIPSPISQKKAAI